MNYDEFQRDVERRKRERWAKILASEPPGPAVRRRPRDPEKERILLKMALARRARERKLSEGDPVVETEPKERPSR